MKATARASLALVAFACASAVTGCASDGTTRGQREELADRVTRAALAGDMEPVKDAFVEARWPDILDKNKVKVVTTYLVPAGAFIGVHDDTPSGYQPNHYHLVAHFEKHDVMETLELDGNGKIVHWHAVNP